MFEQFRQRRWIVRFTNERLPSARFGKSAIARDDARHAEIARFHRRQSEIFPGIRRHNHPARVFHPLGFCRRINKPEHFDSGHAALLDRVLNQAPQRSIAHQNERPFRAIELRHRVGIEQRVDAFVRDPAPDKSETAALRRRRPTLREHGSRRNFPAAFALYLRLPRVPDELRIVPALVGQPRADPPEEAVQGETFSHVIVNREDERFAEDLGQERDIGRRVLQMNQIGPSNRFHQIAIRAIAQDHVFAFQHRLEIRLELRAFRALQTNPHFEIRFAPHRRRDRENESLNSPVAALTGRNDEDPGHAGRAGFVGAPDSSAKVESGRTRTAGLPA